MEAVAHRKLEVCTAFRKLEEPARNRYREKLTIAGEELPDPLDADVRKNVFSTDARQWPRLEIGDIYVYLVEGICFYTREQFKSYKLEDGYNLFLSGKASRVASIDFIKPSKRRRIKTISTAKEVSSHPEATAEQLKDFLKAVKRLAPDTLVLRSLTDSEDTDTAASGDVEDDKDPLQMPETIVDMACLYGSLNESAAREATCSVTECDQVELRTRAQASSDERSRQRVGRLTASILGKVLSCCTGAEGIVSQVMGYTKTPDVFSVRWGRENEVKARNRFIADEAPKHSGFEVRKCDAVLEIKCPASCANLTIDEAK
ncbi:hypothetical protein HPB47_016600, partial [Ixodes persulcatus]